MEWRRPDIAGGWIWSNYLKPQDSLEILINFVKYFEFEIIHSGHGDCKNIWSGSKSKNANNILTIRKGSLWLSVRIFPKCIRIKWIYRLFAHKKDVKLFLKIDWFHSLVIGQYLAFCQPLFYINSTIVT